MLHVRSVLGVVSLTLLTFWGTACQSVGPVDPGPMRKIWWRAAPDRPASRLVVFLPGRSDEPEDFDTRGLRSAVAATWPDTDFVAIDAGLGYYLDRSVVKRLEREVMRPAQAQGYDEIWILGVSLGGLGALLWETEYPGVVTGHLLLAPFLGSDRDVIAEINAEGGADAWEPDPSASPRNFHRLIWQRLATEDMPSNVWMALGEGDRFRPGMELLAQELPASRVRRLPGGHEWSVWTAGLEQLLVLASDPVAE